MALIKCPECRKKVSDKCGKCPYCGYPIESCDESNKPENTITSKKPINKKLLSGIILFFVVLAILGGIVAYNALLPKINATKDFNAAVRFVEEKNRELEAEISRSENLVLQNMPLLDEGHLLALENAISDAKAAKITDLKTPNSTDDIIARTAELNNVDYSEVIGKLKEKHTAFEIDAKRYQLVNVPTEAYVIQCLQTIPEIKGISAVTEDNDPNGNLNKLGGYTATVYFSHESIKLDKAIYGETIIEQGTDGGGAIEVYTCAEDAIKRRDYLAVFDGTVTASGTHTVIGTVLVRTSDKLTASQQKDLEAKLIAALTYLEGIDGNNISESVVPEDAEPPEESTRPETEPTQTNKQNETTVSKKQKAAELAEQIAEEYAKEYPNMVRDILMSEYGFTESQANYGVKNTKFDWNRCAVKRLEEYSNKNGINTKNDAEQYLMALGFSDQAIHYALAKANVDWNVPTQPQETTEKICEHSWSQATCTTRSTCSLCGETTGDYAEHEYMEYTCVRCGKEQS